MKAPSADHSSRGLNRPCYSSQVSNGPCVIALREISVTAQCYSSLLFRRQQENPSSRCEGTSIQRREEKSTPSCGGEVGEREERERMRTQAWERESPLAPLFMFFFLPPWPALCKLGLGRGAVLPEVLTPALDLHLTFFCRLFPSLSFSHLHFGLLFPILTT